jgi:aconitate hydratase
MSTEQNRQYKKTVKFDGKNYWIFDVKKASKDVGLDIEQLPFSLRVLFENVLRNGGNQEQLSAFKKWLQAKTSSEEINFYPARVLMQDFTGVPAIVDLASMRDAIKILGPTVHLILLPKTLQKRYKEI